MFKRNIRKLLRIGFVDQWDIAIIPRPIHSFLNTGLSNDIKLVFKPDRNTFYADPFGITIDNTHYIFYEAFDYCLNQGAINCVEFHQQKIRKVYHNILPIEGHASYPFILEHEGKYFAYLKI